MKKSIIICSFIGVYLFLSGTASNLFCQDSRPVMGAKARMKSWEQHLRFENESPYKNLKWRTVGPEFMGGRIETIACHPDEPFTIYLGVGSGGLWKTVDQGTRWTPIFDDQPAFAMGAVAIAPGNPDIVWAGTGEVLMARSSYSGSGCVPVR